MMGLNRLSANEEIPTFKWQISWKAGPKPHGYNVTEVLIGPAFQEIFVAHGSEKYEKQVYL